MDKHQEDAAFIKLLYEWRDRIEPLRATWDLETVKLLALLNAAGFAGAATVATSANVAGMHPVPLILFGLGLVFALGNMYAGAQSYAAFINELSARPRRYGPDGHYDVEKLFAPKSGIARTLTIAGTALGWGSFFCAVAGGAAIARIVIEYRV